MRKFIEALRTVAYRIWTVIFHRNDYGNGSPQN